MAKEESNSPPENETINWLVDGIWEESTRLETILVVHGYASLRQALARTLQYYGYRTLEASSRDQALRLIQQEQPGVVLLDRALREDDGITLALELAQRPDLHRISVLAITSDRVPEEDLRAHGFREALVMPVEQKDLVAAIDRALEPGRRPAPGLRLELADEQCRLPLEDRLRAEHLTLFFRFPTTTRIELRAGSEAAARASSAALASFGIRPEVEMEDGLLLLRYEVTIAEALALRSLNPAQELGCALCQAYPELASRPDALRNRIAQFEAEYRRLQRMAS